MEGNKILRCAAGGLAAVIYTDTLQTAIMLVGSFILMGFGKASSSLTSSCCALMKKGNEKAFSLLALSIQRGGRL